MALKESLQLGSPLFSHVIQRPEFGQRISDGLVHRDLYYYHYTIVIIIYCHHYYYTIIIIIVIIVIINIILGHY